MSAQSVTQCITNMETAFENCAWVSRHLNSLLWNALHGFTGNDAGYEMERTGVGMPHLKQMAATVPDNIVAEAVLPSKPKPRASTHARAQSRPKSAPRKKS